MPPRRNYLLLCLLLAACTSPPVVEPPTQKADAAPATPPVERIPAPLKPAPVAAKVAKPGPIPPRRLNVVTECRFADEAGYVGHLKLKVDEAKVQAFEAAVRIPRRGNCRFELKNFRQTREFPNVELTHRRDECIVRLWEQGPRVTVAFQRCRKACSGNAWDYMWPILADTRDGSCA